MALQPGVYDVRVTAVGSQPAVVQWTLKPLALDYEKIIENGVGQAPALSLSLVGSLSADPTATSGLGAADGVTNAVISGGSAASSRDRTSSRLPSPPACCWSRWTRA